MRNSITFELDNNQNDCKEVGMNEVLGYFIDKF